MKVLLAIPKSATKVYSKSKIKAAISEIPYISTASLAASLIEDGHEVQIVDFSVEDDVSVFKPDVVGVTFTTPLYEEAKKMAKQVKDFDENIVTVAGGVHASAFPEEVLKHFDAVVVGEGELAIKEVLKGKRGIVKSPLIDNLDSLPLPAWNLYDLESYKSSSLTSRKSPVGAIETSRGCVFGCTYCNKNVFGRKFRYKSPMRVVKEIEHMLSCGFKEIHIWDDNFVTDLSRAKEICKIIIDKRLDFPWCLACGVRVDCVDEEFLKLAKRAGCYSVYFGVESGSQKLLKNVKKGITKEQIRKAFKMAKSVGLETVGFFMFGLPGETEETMKETIRFAKELNPDYAKVTLMVPFPSTIIYDQMKKEGRIKTDDWSKYNFHTASEVYDHENLSWEILKNYYDFFYKRFYFRPSYVLKRIFKGKIFRDIYYFIKTWLI